MKRALLIVGAQSGIGQSLIAATLVDEPQTEIFAVSRNPCPESLCALSADNAERLSWQLCDYTEPQIAEVLGACSTSLGESGAHLDRVVVCNGRLHGDGLQPEKRLEELSSDTLQAIFESNAVIPALWLKHLKPLFNSLQKRVRPEPFTAAVAVLSARIGSIEDNGKGGWYAYRASKAALNMLLKTAAIEAHRTLPALRFIAFHPGTTDTPLSKPFQRSVPEGKLFTPEFVASALLARLGAALARGAAGEGELVCFEDYEGKSIPW